MSNFYYENKMISAELKLIISKALLLSIVWIAVWLSLFASIIFHEQGHYQINKMNGIDSEIKINSFGLGGETITEKNAYLKTNDNCSSLIQQHSMHESIGYTFLPMWFVIVSVSGFFLSLKVMK